MKFQTVIQKIELTNIIGRHTHTPHTHIKRNICNEKNPLL